MDDMLLEEIEVFITKRLNDLEHVPDSVTEAVSYSGECADRLSFTFTQEQAKFWHELEDALSLQAGEEAVFYYKAGFHDAIQFLLGWQQ